jgi:hypothetical protein
MYRKGEMSQGWSDGLGRVKKMDESERVAVAGQDQDNVLRTEGHCKVPGGPEKSQDRADNVRTFRTYPVKG